MSFLIIFLILWIVAPGPIAVLTLNRTRSQGIAAGLAIAAGATATTALIFCVVSIVHLLNLPIVQFSTSRAPKMASAVLLIVLGIHAGYKALTFGRATIDSSPVTAKQGHIFVQGMLIAVSGIPQSIVFYIILIPQSAAVSHLQQVVAAYGMAQIALTFLWYAAIACAVSYVQHWLQNPKMSRRFDFATAILMIGVGVQILI